MIRRATGEDNERVFKALEQEESLQTALIFYLNRYGYSRDFQDVWLIEQDAAIRCVLLRHFNTLYIYCRHVGGEDEEIASFCQFLSPEHIWARGDVLRSIHLYLDAYHLHISFHMVLQNISLLGQANDVELATCQDCREMAALIFKERDFRRFYNSEQEIEQGLRRRIEMGQCIACNIKVDGRIVSQAYSTMQTSHYATIGGVVTHDDYRNQGYASKVVSRLSQLMLSTEKTPNLNYWHRQAGRVYERLGFERIEEYGLLSRGK